MMINLKTFLKTLFEKYKRIVQELNTSPQKCNQSTSNYP